MKHLFFFILFVYGSFISCTHGVILGPIQQFFSTDHSIYDVHTTERQGRRAERTPDVDPTETPVVDMDTPTPEPDDTCEEAEAECQFTFRGATGLQTFTIPQTPDRAFTPDIIGDRAKLLIGVVISNIEGEFIENDGRVIPFSKAIPVSSGITPFSKNVFKPYFPSTSGMFSGIGHETFQTGQLRFARGRCVRVFITDFQIITSENRIVANENGKTDKRRRFCVVFRTAE